MALMVLVSIGALILLYFGSASVLEYTKSHSAGYKKKYENERAKRQRAEKSLRPIANGLAGNAPLEAQIALDDMEKFND